MASRPPSSQSPGSSPLTRGKPGRGGADDASHRLIPAHAGKTPVHSRWCAVGEAHPRSRGENDGSVSMSVEPVGSSPLTRGKLEDDTELDGPRRLIPAHAGKTLFADGVHITVPAHPRSRGENVDGDEVVVYECGSSPLTRGKPGGGFAGVVCCRLIPAHAGKTRSMTSATTESAAHPRSRGENSNGSTLRSGALGSSPLTRGKPLDVLVRHCAPLAHPRSRGENVPSSSHPVSRWGSSPLTRGKRDAVGDQVPADRLIPAHAGKTPTRGQAASWPRAHPRSRGENRLARFRGGELCGSSPLTRGKPSNTGAACAGGRLIPAHAGKTPTISPISRC